MMNTKLIGKRSIFVYFAFNQVTTGIYCGQAGMMESGQAEELPKLQQVMMTNIGKNIVTYCHYSRSHV